MVTLSKQGRDWTKLNNNNKTIGQYWKISSNPTILDEILVDIRQHWKRSVNNGQYLSISVSI